MTQQDRNMRKSNIPSMAIIAIIAMAAFTSCLENDIPYDRIAVGFTSMTAEGETSPAQIDSVGQIVTLTLGEEVDLANVNILSYEISDGAKLSADITGGIDLTSNYKVNVSLYQDYEWLIKANQTIERTFVVPEQIGNSVIDPVGKRVVVNMPSGSDLTAVEVTDVKLGPSSITTMTPDLNNSTTDFSNPVEVAVTYRDVTETWTIYVDETEQTVSLDRADAWTRVMWLYGSTRAGTESWFEYRQDGSDEWLRVENVSTTGAEFSACVAHLQPSTTYEVRACSNDSYTAAIVVTTDAEYELPNSNFEEWWYEEDKIWNPWNENGEQFWDTGNDGAATFAQFGVGSSNSVPDSDTWNGEAGYSAKLETKWVVIKLAGGNIFAGEYVRTDGTNGVLNFGREFTGRPTRITGHWKYTSATINRSSDDAYRHLIGQPDTAIIYAALINKTEPIEIRTNPSNRQLFDRNADYVVAYGEVQTGETISEWTDFDLELEYRRTDVTPTHIVIVSTSSKYADYFTGGEGSTLWLDDFSLGWDY